MSKPQPRHTHDELEESSELLSVQRMRALAYFISGLMVVYSFFGNIYRVPMQIEQQAKEIVIMQKGIERNTFKLADIDKILASKESVFLEVQTTRTRVEAIERLLSAQAGIQQQLDRLDTTTKELAKLIDVSSTKITELNINVINLKDTAADTKRMLDDVKRKQP